MILDPSSPVDAAGDLYDADRLYAELGVRPAINAAGALTYLGGSELSPAVRAAMEAANQRYVDMRTLLESSGRIVAQMLGVEAAYITAGGAASLALSAAACLTREHRDYLERLPFTEGIPNEILVQKNARQRYERCLEVAGARIVEAGGEDGVTPDQLREAIGPNTAALFFLAPGVARGTPPIESVIEVAHEAGLPLIVDAAGQTYPLDNLRRFARLGADLVCYAGKYFDAPHSTGLILGKAGLIELAALNGFIGFETSGTYTFGRPMKVDRQEIAGCVVALREWLAMDHEARLQGYAERIETILRAVESVPGVEAWRMSERETPSAAIRDGVRLKFDRAAPMTPSQLVEALRNGEPSIEVRSFGDTVGVSVGFMHDGDADTVARRLRELLAS